MYSFCTQNILVTFLHFEPSTINSDQTKQEQTFCNESYLWKKLKNDPNFMRKSFKTNSIKNSFKNFFFLNSNTALCFEFLSTYICELRQQYSIVVWLSKNKKRSPLHLSRTGHLPATRWMNSAKLRSKVLQKLRYPYTAVIILKGNVKKSTLMQKTRNLWRH